MAFGFAAIASAILEDIGAQVGQFSSLKKQEAAADKAFKAEKKRLEELYDKSSEEYEFQLEKAQQERDIHPVLLQYLWGV